MTGFSTLSLIIPVYNEAANIFALHEKIQVALPTCPAVTEIIYVDDGSTDATFKRLQDLTTQHNNVQVIQLSKNFGQTAAMAAGIAHSHGDILVFLDGDLQNDPGDIPRLLAKMAEGYDVVSGWRKQRQDARISRILPSLIANRLIARATGVPIHDFGCTLKAYRREIFEHVHLYGEMHRLIPAYAAQMGARIAELEVAHHPRNAGISKYGISRTFRVLLDLLTCIFLGRYLARPAHLFALPGAFSLLLALILLCGRHRLPGSHSSHAGNTGSTLLPLGIQLTGNAAIFLFLVLLAELSTRTYHETQLKAPYVVKQVISAVGENSSPIVIQPLLNASAH